MHQVPMYPHSLNFQFTNALCISGFFAFTYCNSSSAQSRPGFYLFIYFFFFWGGGGGGEGRVDGKGLINK